MIYPFSAQDKPYSEKAESCAIYHLFPYKCSSKNKITGSVTS